MKIRIHRNSLSASMETVAEIEPTKEAVAKYLRDQWGGLGYGVLSDKITVENYCRDNRIGWNTHIVLLDGVAAAFTDGPILPDLPESSVP